MCISCSLGAVLHSTSIWNESSCLHSPKIQQPLSPRRSNRTKQRGNKYCEVFFSPAFLFLYLSSSLFSLRRSIHILFPLLSPLLSFHCINYQLFPFTGFFFHLGISITSVHLSVYYLLALPSTGFPLLSFSFISVNSFLWLPYYPLFVITIY